MFDRLRRHPYLTAITVLACTAVAALILFLATFDLNDYRPELETSLQETLQRPVHFGTLRFTVRHGLGLDIRDAELGATGDPLVAHVEHLVLRLRFFPLLSRKLVFSSLYLDHPQVTLTLTPQLPAAAEPGAETTTADPFAYLRRMRIHVLNIRAATVAIIDRRSGSERHWGVEEMDLTLRNLALAEAATLSATGKIRVEKTLTPWRLSTEIKAPETVTDWQKTWLRLNLSIEGLSPETLASLLGADRALRIAGVCNLTLRGQGTPTDGLAFALKAEGEEFALVAPHFYEKPLRIRNAAVNGTWHADPTGSAIRNLHIRLDEFGLQGDIRFPVAAQAPIEADLAFSATPVAALARFIPDRTLPTAARLLRDPEAGGTLTVDQIRLRWPDSGGMELVTAHANLRDGRFPVDAAGLVEGAEFDLAWQERALTLRTARARLLGGSVSAGGKILFPVNDEARPELKLSADLQAEALLPLLPAPWRERLQLTGRTTLEGNVSGVRSRLLLDLLLHFDQTAIGFDQIPLKAVGQTGDCVLLATATADELALSHARLLLPFAEVRANGRLALDASGAYDLTCDLTHLALDKLPPLLAVQKNMQPQGEADLRLNLSGDRNGLAELGGTGSFTGLKLHLWDAVADISAGSGRMTLGRYGIEFDDISAQVGSSPLRATASLSWQPAFQLAIDLDLPQVRASDLIFRSPTASLTHVRGRLTVTPHGLRFREVSARIQDGTAVVVNGELASFKQPRVILDIEAERAAVADIIALWQGGKARKTRPAAGESKGVGVEIAARIAAGNLYGMKFHNATGTIAVRDGCLIIHPMQLKIGAGTATVQVVSTRLADPALRLAVSGRVERIDADAIYNQMLKRRGLLTGLLTADFHLDGELGNYFPTSNGGGTIHLEKGTLRGFTGLGRVFSLLNLGNLLTLRLPDLGSDGFPYDRIDATIDLRNGLLRTDDLSLVSPALNMALVGSHDLAKDRLDLILGVKPLSTVDKIISSIPLAGWILTGENKALITAHFRITGKSQDPQVEAIPVSSLSEMVLGIFKRTLNLPGKVVGDIKELFSDEEPQQKAPPAAGP